MDSFSDSGRIDEFNVCQRLGKICYRGECKSGKSVVNSGPYSYDKHDFLEVRIEDRWKLLTEQDLIDYWENFASLEWDDDVGISDTNSLDEPGSIPEEQEDKEFRATTLGPHVFQVNIYKWGFKLFVLSGESGFAYKFEIYAGQEESQVSSDQPDFGITGNTVLRFYKDIPHKQNCRLYHDNYYTSLPLMEQAEFRAALAETLCNIERCPLKRGRPSALENKIAKKRRKGPTQHVPPRKVRTDQLGHWLILEVKKMRCKLPTSTAASYPIPEAPV
ncbi:hypothetical protein ILUMI_00657 [Ignelater luminosus]|uniref:PiggyBac transposable element-derived protein domain-containing protein n=1 Tax=Ignelater luminosus TaxID=2038154 RepID=A0A8K0GMF2_IGNLU|nr:hypothetical protein ILUMI_00657 [Ignelater luminosus]